MKQLFADERRTEMQGEAADLSTEDLIAEEEMVVTVSHAGYVKRNPVSLYRAQRRGGRGKTGAAAREEDFLERLFVASTHSYLLVFSDKGRALLAQGARGPAGGPAARGKPIVNLVQLAPGEKVAAILPVRRLPEPPTGRGVPRPSRPASPPARPDSSPSRPGGRERSASSSSWRRAGAHQEDPARPVRPPARGGHHRARHRGGRRAHRRAPHRRQEPRAPLDRPGHGDPLRGVGRPPDGASAYGVKGITLEQGDQVVSAESLPADESAPAGTILTVTANGYGKRTELAEYRIQSRGGKGIITIKTTERNGPVVAAPR